MKKMKLHTPAQTRKNIRKLMALFPNCVSETRDADGRVHRAVDFEQLRTANEVKSI